MASDPFLHHLCVCVCATYVTVCFVCTLFTARSRLCKVLFLTLSVTFLFVYEISLELLNGFAPNSHEKRVWLWSLARTSLIVDVKGQGHQDKFPPTENAL